MSLLLSVPFGLTGRRAMRCLVAILLLAGGALVQNTLAAHAGQPHRVATAPAATQSSISRGGGACSSATSPDCYVFAVQSAGPAGAGNAPKTFTFTCGPATGRDLSGTGATAAFPTPAAGCFNVQATVTNLTNQGADSMIVAAQCGINAETSSGSAANCNGTQSPICPAAPPSGPDPAAPNQGTETGIGDNATCTTLDATSAAQQMNVQVVSGATSQFSVRFTGYTWPCSGASGGPPGQGAPGVPCASALDATTPAGGVSCPTGMTYLSGGTAGFTVWMNVGLRYPNASYPTNRQVPIIEGACQFSVEVLGK